MKPIASRLLAWGGVIVAMTLLPLAAPAADQHDHERQQSGITGQAVIGTTVRLDGVIIGGIPVQTSVAVYTTKGRLVATFSTDADGFFEVALKPGNYVLVPYGVGNGYLSPVSTPVTVRKGDLTVVTVGYYDPPL